MQSSVNDTLLLWGLAVSLVGAILLIWSLKLLYSARCRKEVAEEKLLKATKKDRHTAERKQDDKPVVKNAAKDEKGPRDLFLSGFDDDGVHIKILITGQELIQAGPTGVAIGSDEDIVDKPVASNYCSRRHARFIWKDSNYLIEDLNSTNNSFVDDQQLDPYRPYIVYPGSRIVLGRIRLELNKR